jgi:hypothetical protein
MTTHENDGLMRRLLLLTAVITVLVGPAPAGAADPDPTAPTWTRITDTDGRNTDEVGVARTKDGVLHVLWRKQAGTLQEEIRHTPISATGVVGTTTTATSGFASVGNPDVVVLPDGRSEEITFPDSPADSNSSTHSPARALPAR